MNEKQKQIINEKIGGTVLISIGINHYKDNSEFANLSKCVNDATSVYKTFQNTVPLNFCEEKSILLTSDMDEKSTSKDVILDRIQSCCSKLEANEKIIFFYSGHGYELDGDNYLVPSDNVNTTKEEMISVNEVVHILEASKARIKLILLDSCCSGVVQEKGMEMKSFKYVKDYIATTNSMAIISACGKKKTATEESPNHKLSLFSTFLVEALEGREEALDHGYLTVHSLYCYIYVKMRKISKQYIQINQCPNLYTRTNNYPILGLYQYEFDGDLDIQEMDWDNFYRINLNKEILNSKDNPYREIATKGKVLLSDDFWSDIQMLLNEIILNAFEHGKATDCMLQFSCNKIVLSDNGEKFNSLEVFHQIKEEKGVRGNGRNVFFCVNTQYKEKLEISYDYQDKQNRLTLNFKDFKAFDIEGLCQIVVDTKWLGRYTKDDIHLPTGQCKKYYYYLDMISPCISTACSAIEAILSVIPKDSLLVVMDPNDKYNKMFGVMYELNPRIIYRSFTY